MILKSFFYTWELGESSWPIAIVEPCAGYENEVCWLPSHYDTLLVMILMVEPLAKSQVKSVTDTRQINDLGKGRIYKQKEHPGFIGTVQVHIQESPIFMIFCWEVKQGNHMFYMIIYHRNRFLWRRIGWSQVPESPPFPIFSLSLCVVWSGYPKYYENSCYSLLSPHWIHTFIFHVTQHVQ